MLRLWYNHISVAGVMSVTLTNAEKKQCYRERHLGANGTKQRVQHFLSVPTKAQLDRLASYHGYTVTRMIEDLAAAAERKILDRLSPAEGRACLDGKLASVGLSPPEGERSRRTTVNRKRVSR
jgi:hypothetical protein